MNKDAVWEKMKRDRTEVYGVPMIDMFLKLVDGLEWRHWNELTPAQRKSTYPEVRLKWASTVEDAEAAVRDGAGDWEHALYGAAERGNKELCNWAIAKGAGHLDGALFSAAKGGHFGLCKWLVAKGARNFEFALKGACEDGHLEICKWAFDKSSNYLSRDVGYYLRTAAENGHLDIVEWFLGNGEEYDANNLDWALRGAAMNGHLEVCKVLYEKGARDLEGALYVTDSREVEDYLKQKKEESE